MAGCYGSDQLNNALLILGIALIIVARILGWAWMNVFILALLCLCYFRMFSRNIQARYAENEKFMRFYGQFKSSIARKKANMVQRRTHRIYKCPNCKQSIRVPKGKGRIAITCPRCKTEFIKRS